MRITVFLLLTLILSPVLKAQDMLDYQPKVLLVTAHPDDDALFSATVFKTTRMLNGTVDLALMTNGEGGYKYSTLGNYIYGKELDKEEVGRDWLPSIRKKELMAGGDVVGIRNYFFFDQQDFYYTKDVQETMTKWDTTRVLERLESIMTEENYDFMFLMLPTEATHGHHKASAVLALEAMSRLPESDRPVALLGYIRNPGEDGAAFDMLSGYPRTKVMEDIVYEFDRNQPFGYDNRLNYNIIANWVIAEHKSQGTMQLLMTRQPVIEQYRYLEINGTGGMDKAAEYFRAVDEARPEF